MARAKTVVKFQQKACCKYKEHVDYLAPNSNDIRELIELMNWTYADVARLVGVAYTSKGSSPTVQRWCANEESKDHRKIPYSAWRLLLVYAGFVDKVASERKAILNR